MDLDILKIDLDLEDEQTSINLIKERITFLINIGLLKKSLIKKIILIKKTNYSCKIYLNKPFKEPLLLLLFQSLLSDDYKHTGISLRDYLQGVDNWNRLFNIKRYSNGEYKKSIEKDITTEVLK